MLPTMTRPWTGFLAILVNVVVTGVVYAVIAKNKTEEEFAEEVEEEDISFDDIEIL